jgi:preprotein translocase subunit SecG
MNIIKEIIGNSAIGNSSNILKTIVLSLFTTIFFTLCIMLSILIRYGSSTSIQFGY